MIRRLLVQFGFLSSFSFSGFAGPVPEGPISEADAWKGRIVSHYSNNRRSLAERNLFHYNVEGKRQVDRDCRLEDLENFPRIELARSKEELQQQLAVIQDSQWECILPVYLYFKLSVPQREDFLNLLKDALVSSAVPGDEAHSLRFVLEDPVLVYALFENTPAADWNILVSQVLIPWQVFEPEWWDGSLQASVKELAYFSGGVEAARYFGPKEFMSQRSKRFQTQLFDTRLVVGDRQGAQMMQVLYAPEKSPLGAEVLAALLQGGASFRNVAFDYILHEERAEADFPGALSLLDCREDRAVFYDLINLLDVFSASFGERLRECMSGEARAIFSGFNGKIFERVPVWLEEPSTDLSALLEVVEAIRPESPEDFEQKRQAIRRIEAKAGEPLRLMRALEKIAETEDLSARAALLGDIGVFGPLPASVRQNLIEQAREELSISKEDAIRNRVLLASYCKVFSSLDLSETKDEMFDLAVEIFDLPPDEASDPALKALVENLLGLQNLSPSQREKLEAMSTEF